MFKPWFGEVMNRDNKTAWGIALRMTALMVPLVAIIFSVLNSRITSLSDRVSGIEERHADAMRRIEVRMDRMIEQQQEVLKWVSKRQRRLKSSKSGSSSQQHLTGQSK